VKTDQLLENTKRDPITEENREMVSSDPLLSGHISPSSKLVTKSLDYSSDKNERLCQVTGVDISNQKDESRFLASTGLRWLFKTHRERYNELRGEFLSPRWFNESLDVQFREMAHSIRNKYNNPRHTIKKRIRRVLEHPSLFDQRPFIDPDKLQVYKSFRGNQDQKRLIE